jgi:hypothetical protein
MKYARIQDRLAVDRPGLTDLSWFPGTWLNTNRQGTGIAKVILSVFADSLRVRVFGAGDGGLLDWGEVVASTIYTDSPASHRGMSFTAAYDLGFMECHLEGNLNLGLLVLASLNQFEDGSGRSDYFAREFFYRAQVIDATREPLRSLTNCSRGEENRPLPAGETGLTHNALIGDWRNTNAESGGIARILITDGGAGVCLRTFGAGDPEPIDWGEAAARVFAKSVDSREGIAFHARYAFDFMETRHQANVKQGVLVVATFTEFQDTSGRSNYFWREFYYEAS